MKKIKKVVSILAISVLLFSLVIFEPTSVRANGQSAEVLNLELDGSQFEMIEKVSTENNRVIVLKREENEDLIDVNYETGDFTVTSKDGVVEKYNIKDFESNEAPEASPLVPEEDYFLPEFLQENNGDLRTELPQENLQSISPRTREYLGDIALSLGFSGKNVTWTLQGTYNHSGTSIQALRGDFWQYTTTPKKYSFPVGTTVSTILGAIAAFAGAGFTLGALNAVLLALNISVVAEAIAHYIDPTMGVKQLQVGRGFNVINKGFTIKTKNWYNYISVDYNGKNRLEEYSTDKYAYWYNNYSNSNLSELAYQQYRYIERLRGTEPSRQEFSWAW